MVIFIIACVLATLMFFVGFFASGIGAPVINYVVAIATEPLSIPIINQLILWGSVCSGVIVIVVRVGKAIYDIMISPNPRPGVLAEWVVKTIIAVAGTALMPVFCSMVITIGETMFSDIQGVTLASQVSTTPIDEDWINSFAAMPLENLGRIFCSAIFLILAISASIKVAYDLMKRQFTILTVSLIAPWVSIKAGMESADDYLDLLCSLFGVCVTQWAQYVFYVIAMSMFTAYAGTGCWAQVDFLSTAGIGTAILIIAAMGGALGVPTIIERYAFSSGRGGAGAMIIGIGLRGGITAAARMPSKIASAVATHS